jgi:serpin B
VYVPRFKMTSEFGLGNTFQAMGMTLAFDQSKADFSGMSSNKEGLYISAVVHKAFVDVNEEGTEAAAATGVVMRAMAAMPVKEEPPTFRADHPFLFMIRENQTGSILFMGRVTNPKQ